MTGVAELINQGVSSVPSFTALVGEHFASVDWLNLLGWICKVIIALLAWPKIKSRLFAFDFMGGMWAGTMICEEFKDVSLSMRFSFSSTKSGMPSGMSIYKKKIGMTSALEGADMLLDLKICPPVEPKEWWKLGFLKWWKLSFLFWSQIDGLFAQLYQNSKGHFQRIEEIDQVSFTVSFWQRMVNRQCHFEFIIIPKDKQEKKQTYRGILYRQ